MSVPVIPNKTLWAYAAKRGMNDSAAMGWDYCYERDWREGNN